MADGKERIRMIIRKEERNTVEKTNLKGGCGTAILHYYEVDPMPCHAKMFAELELNPGVSLGAHPHEGEFEAFFFTEGHITLNDNGVEKIMNPGDFALCRDGEIHGIRNDTDKPAKLLATIILK